MRAGIVLALVALSACASKPDIAASSSPSGTTASASTISAAGSLPYSTVTPVPPTATNCREFTVPIRIGKEEKQAVGRACEQPDGSWRIVPSEGQTPVVIERTDIYPAYPYYGPRWYGPPFGFGAFAIFGVRHHHHHHGHR
jgi:hypothetical protein